jgi:hypothetical protein
MLKFYTQMEYDKKNMYEFFKKIINFISLCARYIYDKLLYTGYVSNIVRLSPAVSERRHMNPTDGGALISSSFPLDALGDSAATHSHSGQPQPSAPTHAT